MGSDKGKANVFGDYMVRSNLHNHQIMNQQLHCVDEYTSLEIHNSISNQNLKFYHDTPSHPSYSSIDLTNHLDVSVLHLGLVLHLQLKFCTCRSRINGGLHNMIGVNFGETWNSSKWLLFAGKRVGLEIEYEFSQIDLLSYSRVIGSRFYPFKCYRLTKWCYRMMN